MWEVLNDLCIGWKFMDKYSGMFTRPIIEKKYKIVWSWDKERKLKKKYKIVWSWDKERKLKKKKDDEIRCTMI